MKFLAPLALCGLAAALCLQPARAGDWEDAQAAFADYDDATGLRLLERAAHQGDLRAMQGWGLALLHGRRVFPSLMHSDVEQAAVWFDKVALRCAQSQAGQIESPCQKSPAVQLTKRCLAQAAHGTAQCPVELAVR